MVSMNKDVLDGVARGGGGVTLVNETCEEKNGSVNAWERQWRDGMPSSTRMWRAVSEQKKQINTLVLSAAARRRAAA